MASATRLLLLGVKVEWLSLAHKASITIKQFLFRLEPCPTRRGQILKTFSAELALLAKPSELRTVSVKGRTYSGILILNSSVLSSKKPFYYMKFGRCKLNVGLRWMGNSISSFWSVGEESHILIALSLSIVYRR